MYNNLFQNVSQYFIYVGYIIWLDYRGIVIKSHLQYMQLVKVSLILMTLFSVLHRYSYNLE